MREHKYRAWDKEEKRFWTQKEMTEIGGYYYTWGLGNYNGRFILMQFTGLFDKNKKEIYAGDIVEIQITHETKTSYKSQVYFDYDGACVDLHPAHKSMGHKGTRRLSEYLFIDSDFSQSKCKVVGNVHQNPELLEK